ncbi:MAG: hypothetical protein ACAI35_14580 [Candidatus Methylacidiphilales bacterium]
MTDISFLVIIFDEFADLVLADCGAKREFEEQVVRLAAKGRARGFICCWPRSGRAATLSQG